MSIDSDVGEEEHSEKGLWFFFFKGKKVYLDTQGEPFPNPNKKRPTSRMLKIKNIKFSKHSTGKKITSKVSDINLTYFREQNDSVLLFHKFWHVFLT